MSRQRAYSEASSSDGSASDSGLDPPVKSNKAYDEASSGESDSDSSSSSSSESDGSKSDVEDDETANTNKKIAIKKPSDLANLPLHKRMLLEEERRMTSAGQNLDSDEDNSILSTRKKMKLAREADRKLNVKAKPLSPGPLLAKHKQENKRKGSAKLHKNAPAEQSSKRRVSKYHIDNTVFNLKKKKVLDPRFMDYSGELKERIFHKNYDFLNDYQQDEIEKMSRNVKRVKSEKNKEALKAELVRNKQQQQDRRRAYATQERLDEMKKIEKEKVASGKKVFHLKRSAKKDIEMEEKYKDLKKTGKLKSYLMKKRKSNAQDDKKYIPNKRSYDD